MFKTRNPFVLALILIALVALIVIGPLITIIALNHLFKTGIELSFMSWSMVAWLQFVLFQNFTKSKA